MRYFDTDTFNEIIQTITRNKVRSLMTAFGVFWGVFMLVLMVGAGNGLANGTTKGVKEFAANSVFFFSDNTSIPYKGFQKNRYWSIKNSDLPAIKQKYSGIRYISGMLWGDQSDNNISYGDKYGSFQVRGFSPDYMKIDTQHLLYGRFLNNIDINERRKVCIIGEKVYNTLFTKGTDPTGELIKVKGIFYRIVGVTRPATRDVNIGGDPKELVGVPITTLQQVMNTGEDIHGLAVTMQDNLSATEYEEKIKTVLKERHQIAPDDEKAVRSFNVSKIFQIFGALGTGIEVLIWIVGLGTLFTGVIGVSNIMLVTVKERTQEIGVRRALGAIPLQIITQIMSESLVLTAVAGMVGMILSVGILGAVSSVMEANPNPESFMDAPQISFATAIAATIIIAICGMLAGLLPSYRALQIKAIDALRDE